MVGSRKSHNVRQLPEIQHNSQPHAGSDSSPGKTVGVNHDESESQTCLAKDDPVEEPHDLLARAEENLSFRRNIFQQHAVKACAKDDEDKCREERDDGPLHEFGVCLVAGELDL